jgi:hypothetical protein
MMTGNSCNVFDGSARFQLGGPHSRAMTMLGKRVGEQGFCYYNFCLIHKSHRVTPAMAAGVTDRVWDMADAAALIAAQETPVVKRGPRKLKAA